MERESEPSSAVSSERMQDVLLILSFGFWAVLLGFFPIMAFHSLMGH